MWTKSENSSAVKPEKTEQSGNQVIVRRNFKLIPETEERAAHYEYEEWQMSKEQYEVYQPLEEIIKEQEDALVELAGLISEAM